MGETQDDLFHQDDHLAAKRMAKEAQWHLLRLGDALLKMGDISPGVLSRMSRTPTDEDRHSYFLSRFRESRVQDFKRIRAALAISVAASSLKEAYSANVQYFPPAVIRLRPDTATVDIYYGNGHTAKFVSSASLLERIAAETGVDVMDSWEIWRGIVRLVHGGFLRLPGFESELVLVPQNSK